MKKVILVGLAAVAAMAAQAQIRQAGTTYVWLDAAAVTGVAEGAPVAEWPNLGTLAKFVPAAGKPGATFSSNFRGAKALVFDGSANCVMTQDGFTDNAGAGGVPPALLGPNTVWSVEVWAANPAASGIETLLAWTSRRQSGNDRMMEVRWASDRNNAVEHFAHNMAWGMELPAENQWHHIAVTREVSGFERLYLDGRQVSTLDLPALNLWDYGALFSVGGVDTGNGWDYFLSGAVAVVRVHGGTLSAADVKANFEEERHRFGGGVLASASGWNSGASWEGGAVPLADTPTYASGGGKVTYSGAPYAVTTNMLYGISGEVEVAGGTFVATSHLRNNYTYIGLDDYFTLTVSGGLFGTLPSNYLTLGENGGTGILNLKGGTAQVFRIEPGANSTGHLIADGGVLEATASVDWFIRNLNSAVVRAGGLAVDVPQGMAVTIPQGFTEDGTSTGGGIAKLGSGTLTMTGQNTVWGPVNVQGGKLFLQQGALPSAWAGGLSLANGAQVCWNEAGGAAKLAAGLQPGADGAIILMSANANDSINLAAFPNVSLISDGTFEYTGAYTPYENVFRFYPAQGMVTFGQVIADVPGHPGRVEVHGEQQNACVMLTGNNAFSGGTLVTGGAVGLGATGALGGSGAVICKSGTAVRVYAEMPPGFIGRVDATDGEVSLQLNTGGLANTIDLSAQPNVWLGSDSTGDGQRRLFTGTLTPYGDTYQLGNTGLDPNDTAYGLRVEGLGDAPGGAARKAVVRGKGVAQLHNCTYSGGIRIERGGKLYMDADSAFGAVPQAFEPANVVFSNGALRTLSKNLDIPATRGVRFEGAAETRIHSTGTLPSYLAFHGDISGTAPLRFTDMGWVVFAGTNNTYNGKITLDNGTGGVLVIGNGTNFSWSSTGTIEGRNNRGYVYLNTDGNAAFSDQFYGKGVLIKRGAGVLTLATPQLNWDNLATGYVSVEAGTLRYGVADALAADPSASVVNIFDMATLDLNGFSTALNGLAGGGLVTSPSPVTLQLGRDTLDSRFDGLFDANVTLEKVSTNTVTLGNAAPASAPVSVLDGTLALGPAVRMENGVSLAAGAALAANGAAGLRAEYFDDIFPHDANTSWSELGNTVAGIDTMLAGHSPTLVSDCASFADVFDSGAGGEMFPGKYSGGIDYFVTRFTGTFRAEADGDYRFDIFADDGCLLFIDGALVVNNRTGSGWASGTANLTTGVYDILIFFYEKGGAQVMRVEMTPPGGERDYLPLNLLGVYPTYAKNVSGGDGTVKALANAHLILEQTANGALPALAGDVDAVIEKCGMGVSALTPANPFAGTFRISEGEVTASGETSLGGLDVTANGTLRFDGLTRLTCTQTKDTAFEGTLTGGTADSVFVKAGPGAMTFVGGVCDISGYQGAWEVADGELVFDCDTDISIAGDIHGAGKVRVKGSGHALFMGNVTCGLVVESGATAILDGPATSDPQCLDGTIENNGTLVFKRQASYLLLGAITGAGRVVISEDTQVMLQQGNLVSGQSLALNGGTAVLNNGSIRLIPESKWHLAGMINSAGNWQLEDGHIRFTDYNGKRVLQLTKNEGNTRNAAQYLMRLPTAQPFVIQATYRGVGSGDGFGFFFHNDARGFDALPTGWHNGVGGLSPSFGFQYYLMTGSAYFTWMNNGSISSDDFNNQTNAFYVSKALLTARLAYDGTTMISEYWQGDGYQARTNETAGAKMAALGQTAILGIFGGTGGLAADQYIEEFAYTPVVAGQGAYDVALVAEEGSASVVRTDVAEADALPFIAGDVTVKEGSTLTFVPADGTPSGTPFIQLGNINVLGSGQVAVAPGSLAAFAGDSWSFVAGNVLTLTGDVTLPATIHVTVTGDIQGGRVDLADLRGANLTAPVEWVLASCPIANATLGYRNGILFLNTQQGTTIILR